MEEDLRNTLIVSGDKTQYDLKAKKILARKSILSRILAATVEEFKGMPLEEIEKCIDGDVYISTVPTEPGITNTELKTEKGDRIAALNTEDFENGEGLARYDILFYVRMKDGISQIIINLEAQKDEPSEYSILNRAIFYVSRLISSQKERDFTDSNYNDLKRVYTIWICMNMENCIWNHIHLTNDVIMEEHDWKGNLDLINIVLLGIPNKLPEQDEQYELHRLLSALFSVDISSEERIDILQDEYNIAYEDAFRKELIDMCNLSQGIWERGIEQGIERGEKEAHRKDAIRLYKKGKDVPFIAEMLNESVEQVEEWVGLVPA